MAGKLVGKELIHSGEELHKSRTSLPVLDVIFEKIRAAHWDVYAVTQRGRYQIGAIHRAGNWVGSRDLISTQNGRWVRPFIGTSSGETVSQDKEDFINHWKGSSIFVHPELPATHEHGDIYIIGGDSMLIDAWLRQSKVWMRLAEETSARNDIQEHYCPNIGVSLSCNTLNTTL